MLTLVAVALVLLIGLVAVRVSRTRTEVRYRAEEESNSEWLEEVLLAEPPAAPGRFAELHEVLPHSPGNHGVDVMDDLRGDSRVDAHLPRSA